MTPQLAWFLVSWVAVAVGMVANLRSLHAPRAYRIAPLMVVSASLACALERSAALLAIPLSLAQHPLKPYMPALLVLSLAALVLTQLVRQEHRQ